MTPVTSRRRPLRHRFSALIAATLALLTAATVAAAGAGAAPVPGPARTVPSGGYEELWVPSAMGNVKVQVQWAARGGNASLYLLDGLRALPDRNAWSFDTNAMDQFRHDNITLVMPVGGESSFYTDWYYPSNFNQQQVTYKWETFLTRELPDFLARYGVERSNTGIAGVSMGGTAAMTLAAHHRDQFKFAGSYSGYLNTTAPGMREAIRIAMLDAGRYNVDAMWGPPWNPAWLRNDPFVVAPQLQGMSLYVSAGTGFPGIYDHPGAPIEYWNTAMGMGLELLSMTSSRAFQIRLATLGIPATFSFPPSGIHSWPYWSGELWQSRAQILHTLNAW
ncbi:esterase family protein [Rhodococcus triatomae]|uniref:Diacylglycerol O-acyltransferase / trehalose O-mycolyltransferase n=1 Tax=Rhodococcus triatomae TaxID=300028 RepID=A0A1G8GXT4_9NOCA|nr:alpha/beta hydrolase family protein [Rhodococcus triatomae]QNG20267.1 esterase family protein [Rhodococcus triatomae]QNG23818.1 esterase family protein [Rhodococcus triatomae]SDH99164.1 diacylglycerol O-acyltransferase / trehalose O-mycolyltransferase [Rhodococcus triatomae]